MTSNYVLILTFKNASYLHKPVYFEFLICISLYKFILLNFKNIQVLVKYIKKMKRIIK